MNIPVLFEDDYLVAIDKPSGIVVNSSETTKKNATLQDFAKHYIKVLNESEQALKDGENTFVSRCGIVHRLDKETSGILLIAKNEEAYLNLQRQFKERVVRKEYIALAHGRLTPQVGEIRVPIGRLPWNRMQFGVVVEGKDAVTCYKVMQVFWVLGRGERDEVSLLRLFPETGRTHQIRVHMRYLGHPIFSDQLYAGRKQARDDRKRLSRIFLHATKIQFYHPKTQKMVTVESQLPTELQEFLRTLRPV